MKFEEIIRDKDRLYSGKWFKRRNKSYYIKWNEKLGFVYITAPCDNEDFLQRYSFSPEDFLSDEWQWVEKWYEGDFKKKHPNGVLCWVWDNGSDKKYIDLIVDYSKNKKCPAPFDGVCGNWKNAKPVSKKDPIKFLEDL